MIVVLPEATTVHLIFIPPEFPRSHEGPESGLSIGNFVRVCKLLAARAELNTPWFEPEATLNWTRELVSGCYYGLIDSHLH